MEIGHLTLNLKTFSKLKPCMGPRKLMKFLAKPLKQFSFAKATGMVLSPGVSEKVKEECLLPWDTLS